MKSERLISLDAFRGFVIAGMILVNNPRKFDANRYPQLIHSVWHGWTFTDFIFPSFLWIVGVSMVFSIAVRKNKGDSNGKLFLGVLRRCAILFVLGFFINGLWWNHYSNIVHLRIPGTLQRIAICYLIASLIYLYLSKRAQVIAIGVLFISYTMMMFYIPIPEFGAGLFEQGKNFASYIDSILLTGHMDWHTITWDSEGIISTIPAIATTLFGAIAGDYLLSLEHTKIEKTVWLFLFGSGFLLLGATFDMWMPINKNLWTVSFSVFMAGWTMYVFGIFFFLIDVKGIIKWAYPFIVFGINAIFVFVLSGVTQSAMLLRKVNVQLSDGTYADVSIDTILTNNLLDPYFSPLNASLIHAIGWVFVMYSVVWVMYKNKWFIKI